MQYVVNEWLLDLLIPGSSRENTQKVNSFLFHILQQQHQLVIGRQNNFTRKFYRYMKQYGWDQGFKERFQKLNNLLFRDSARTYIIDENELAILNGKIISKTPPDDIYLIRLAFSTEDKTIITTDIRLKEALKDVTELSILLLEDFLCNC